MTLPLTSWPARFDFEIAAGATFERRLTWRDANGDPIDLTGFEANLTARRSAKTAPAILVLEDGDGITLGGADGTITIRLEAVDTAGFTWRTAVYALKLTDVDDATILLEGVLNVVPEVTFTDPV